MSWTPWLLLFHVLGSIIAFGPTFIFPLVAGMGGRDPAHAGFAQRLIAAIDDRVVLPVAAFVGITGVLLIADASIDLAGERARWLLASIIIYVFAMAFAVGVQRRNVHRLIGMMAGGPPAAGASAGPPPEMAGLIGTIRRGGMLLTLLAVLVTALMVLKPTF